MLVGWELREGGRQGQKHIDWEGEEEREKHIGWEWGGGGGGAA